MRRGGRLLTLLGCGIAALIGAVILAHAVITSAANKIILAGNGATTAFAFPFVGVAAADLTVIYADASGNQTTLTQGSGPTQYQVTLNTPSQGSLWGLGGTVTYNPSGTPIASGTTLTIARTLPYTQGVSLQNQASTGQLGKSSEQALDLLEMQIQQLAESNARTITIPLVDPAGIVTTLPAAAQRANQALVFDSLGNATAGVIPGSGVISAPMAPVVGAVSLGAARTALGLRALATEGIGAGLQDDGAGNARVNAGITGVAVSQSSFIHNAQYVVTGPINFTLPRANTLFPGFGFWVHVIAGGPLTLIPNAADTIVAQQNTSGAVATLPVGTWAWITTSAGDAGFWLVGVGAVGETPVAGGSFANLSVSASGTVATITANEVVIPGLTNGNIYYSVFSIACNFLFAGINGVDVGPTAVNSWYSVWAVSNGTTLGCLASLSATAPTMPAGYNFRKRLGWVLTSNAGGAALTPSLQKGRVGQWPTPPLITASFGTYWTAQSVTTQVPPTASRIRMILEVQATASGGNEHASVAPNTTYGTAPNQSIYPPCGSLLSETGAVTVVSVANQVCDLLLESTNVYTGTVAASAHLYALGWEDNL